MMVLPLQGRLTIERSCQLAEVSRSGFYRFLKWVAPVDEDMELRSLIQKMVLEKKRRYGYRRVREELLKLGIMASHRRVLRIMREDNLLAVQPKVFVTTTDSRHNFEVSLNLARRMKVTGPNQLWVADLTYIRLQREFVFLAVLLDAFSRKVIGWNLGRRMNAELCLTALRQALAERKPAPGLVHHSDRGIQYAAQGYIDLLQQHQILSSMSRTGNPWDNAICESFIKTLKHEEIRGQKFADLQDLHQHLVDFIVEFYNPRRLHSALGYRSPEEFEREHAASTPANSCAAARLSFPGHGEIYQGNGEQPRQDREPDHSPTHCVDESPAGYSSAGCSPAEPACASPAGDESATTKEKEETKKQ